MDFLQGRNGKVAIIALLGADRKPQTRQRATSTRSWPRGAATTSLADGDDHVRMSGFCIETA
ncbi:hypothetical protein D7243_09125 [Stutzerimonas stutzeri]|nr:hypothetical protein [Stutzerimonas stutzeri]